MSVLGGIGSRAALLVTLLIVAPDKPAFADVGVDREAAGSATTSAASSTTAVSLVSAFFGLDNKLPFRANLLCLGASGKDGMPVVLSHTIDPDTLDAADFQVVTGAGVKRVPDCVTLRPAQDPGELRTVLLIGEFGDAPNDPPASVRVVGDLLSDGSASNAVQMNYRGLEIDVIPLAAGPSLVLAETVPLRALTEETRGTRCPADVQQVVRVTWAGGVRLPNRDELGDKERKMYRVKVQRPDGAMDEVVPAALADLADGDNNHLLCLDTTDQAVAVSFPAGQLIDPNRDLNPATQIAVNPGAQ